MRQDVTSSRTPAIHRFTPSVCLLLPHGGEKKEKKTPSSYPAFTVLVNPSQLQSVMIRSLINATGKKRSKLGRLKTSQYLGLNNTSILLSCDSTASCHPICEFTKMHPLKKKKSTSWSARTFQLFRYFFVSMVPTHHFSGGRFLKKLPSLLQ